MSRIRDLVREIHRRSLWQVLGIYLVGSWIALQVVDTLTGTLGLPEWFPALAFVLLLVGLPIVLATAFVQEGDAGAAPAATEGAPERWLTWPKALGFGVVAFASLGAAGAWLAWGGPGGGDEPIRSLAVLPLANHTGDPGQEYLVAGMHEALIGELTKIASLDVTSRTSVMRYRDGGTPVPRIAQELGGVDAIVEGSVFQAGDSVRVRVQLVDADADRHLWGNDYAGDLGNLMELQSRVARSIAEEIRIGLTPEDRTRLATPAASVEPTAVERYLRGRAAWRGPPTPENLDRSIALYREALEIAPDYALAWAGLADAYLVYAHTGMDPHEAFPRAKEAAERALELAPDLARAHTALADVRFHYEWDWEGAERAFRRAIELNPGYATAHWWYSGLLAALGRTDEAADRILRATELDPLAPGENAFAVRILHYGGRHAEAVAVVERIRELGITEWMAPPWYALSLHALGESEAALAAVEQAIERRATPYALAARARILAETGRASEALEIVEDLAASVESGRSFLPHLVAIGYAALDQPEAALDWLERAADMRDAALPWLAVEPAFAPLRERPRFDALEERMGLVGR